MASLTLEPGPVPESAFGPSAYVIQQGLLIRRLRLPGGSSVELLGRDDVLIPGREDAASFVRSEWEAVEPARLAEIDLSPGSPLHGAANALAGLTTRAVARSRAIAAQAAIMSIVGVEERVHALLWLLAERWGEVTPAGVELRLDLPQAVLAEMVGARRQTVNRALAGLTERGLLAPLEPGGWLLLGEPPLSDP
mgnify:CR=1 FL=1